MATSRKGKKVDDPLQLHHGIRIGIYRGYNRIATAKIDGFAWLDDATGERMIRLLLTGVPTIPIVSRKTEQDVPFTCSCQTSCYTSSHNPEENPRRAYRSEPSTSGIFMPVDF